jgi:hypothetical protein
MGTTRRTKSNGFLALPVAVQKSASSTGGGPSGEFVARNPPRAGPNHPRGGTDGIQPAAGSPTTPGWCRPAHARAGGVRGAGFGVQEPTGNSSGGAMPSGGRHPIHRAGERSFLQLPSVRCKPRQSNSASLFKIVASLVNICWLLHMRHRPLWV